MKNNTFLKIIILFFIILFFCLLCISFLLLQNLKSDSKKAVINDERLQSVEEVIIASESQYIKEEENKIYLSFAKDLFNDNEESNEIYFNKLVDDLKRFYDKKDFYLIDESKKIEIYVNYKNENYEIIINEIEDYYKNVDAKVYLGTKNIKYPERQVIHTTNQYLRNFIMVQMSTKYLSQMFEEGENIENNYVSYNDGAILLRTTNVKTVRNIIFTYKYNEEIVKGVNMKTSLKEIKELYPNNAFGSLDEEYLGYYTDDYYYFFYEDEVSVYPISYYENDKFEQYLSDYSDDNDLDKFVRSIQNGLKDYDYFEYDSEIGKVHIMFSHKGYEIDIEDNNSKGIILYSNYYLTDTSRNFIQRELITQKPKENAVDKLEKERRRNR